MSRKTWHLHMDADGLTLARHWPPRFDVRACVVLMTGGQSLSLSRLAHQVRQDLWRALRDLRGFSPVVTLRVQENSLHLCAGGRAARPIALSVNARIHDLLNDPALNERWIRWAKQGKAA